MCEYKVKHKVRFEILTAVVIKNSILWDMGRVVRKEPANISEEHIFSIFSVEE
jgi:hypothetical protein